ncbi:MAG: hypothetical protein JOY78_18860 [Pseudonocardia sp.]|nr:hypothetical protein [Pseudonocardia sp.]
MITSRGMRRTVGSIALAAGLAGGLVGCGGGGGAVAASSTTSSSEPAGISPATTQALNLPYVKGAQLTACEEEFQTLRSVEHTYQLVNDGHYASMRELLDGQYISGPLTYYVDVKIGTPVDGFTLIAAPDGPCASLPVRDPH